VSTQSGKPATRASSFLHLPGPDRVILLQALVMLPALSLGLKLIGFRRVYQLLNRWAPSPDEDYRAGTVKPERIADLVGKAAWRGFYPVSCLPRSLSLWALLHRSHLPGELCIGVRRSETGIQAHAWVEVDRVPLLEQPDIGNAFIPIPFSQIDQKFRWK
jgi:Transglutaminase-like superfamily